MYFSKTARVVLRSSSTPTTEYCVSTANFARSSAPFVLKGLAWNEEKKHEVSLQMSFKSLAVVHHSDVKANKAQIYVNSRAFVLMSTEEKRLSSMVAYWEMFHLNARQFFFTSSSYLFPRASRLECKCTRDLLSEHKSRSPYAAIESQAAAGRERLACAQHST